MHQVVFLQGGGVGRDQEASVRRVLEAAGVAIEFRRFDAGGVALSDEVVDVVRRAGVALKTKLLPVAGAGVPVNLNVELRRRLGLFASVRPVHNLRGLPGRFDGVNFLLVREITEDLYATTEHEIVPGVVQSFKIVTETACLRFFRFAFDLARKTGRKSVHCIHKANILKQADGLYLDCFRRVAAEFPGIAAKDLIVDNACMQLVSRPTQFEVMAAGNLYGDLLGDLGAGLVGGISAATAINHGDGVRVYEAVYGAGHDAVPPGRANPLPLLLPAVEMLRDLGETAAADKIIAAVEGVLTDGVVRPADLGGSATTDEFTAAVVGRLV